jgi:hypothetical protein
MRQVWDGALEILNGGDREWKQMLPRDLDDERYHGREHIDVLLSIESHICGSEGFVDLARAFLSVITHPALLDCLSVDTFVGNLYNFFSGSNGNRAVPFFKRLGKNLAEAHSESTAHSPTVALDMALLTMSTALCELLRREQRAAFHEDLPDLANSMESVRDLILVDKGTVAFTTVTLRIADVRAIIARANGLINGELSAASISTTTPTSTYPQEIAPPGTRHDNDKMDITKVEILPTEDEIRSDHVEFLPSTDPDQYHFLTDPADRHLDTHFRLLRHDVFGELKQALGGLMTAVESDPALLTNSRISLGEIRAYPYPKAHIRYVSYEKRRGLDIQISFPQLPLLRKKKPSERRMWWEESKRLGEGILLCFVSLNGTKSSMLFLTVSDKCTDAKVDFSLSSSDRESTITAKFAAWNQSNFESLIRLSCQRTRGVLIEFPGVLLATFVPILKNLQDIHKQSRLPFRQWIIPDRIGTNGSTSSLHIPPPLYARNPQFAFSLKKILRNPLDDFVLSPNTPIDDTEIVNKIEKRTTLDRGQCQALIAALTREFAFIQGPPGMRKSSPFFLDCDRVPSHLFSAIGRIRAKLSLRNQSHQT